MGDVPPIEVVILDRKDLPSAGAGETPIFGLAPAVGNAIFAASGVRLHSLPMLPDGVLPPKTRKGSGASPVVPWGALRPPASRRVVGEGLAPPARWWPYRKRDNAA